MSAIPPILPETLTKSRFRMACECPRKLVYCADPRYANTLGEDRFLESLADGGHQVGALAKLMHPGGIEITAGSLAEQQAQTRALLERENVTLFEATVAHGPLLVRVDVLIKRGLDVELIEVKSKACADDARAFVARGGAVASAWRPYLQDVAFQTLVLNRAHPSWRVTPILMLVDPSASASVDGLGAKLPVRREGRRVFVDPAPDLDPATLSPPLLRRHDVSALVASLRTTPGPTPAGTYTLEQFADWLAEELVARRVLPPYVGAHCKRCEYICEPEQRTPTQRSGWAECLEATFARPLRVARAQTVFALYNHRKIKELLDRGRLLLADLRPADLDPDRTPGTISTAHRHELQVQEARAEPSPRHLEADTLRDALRTWRFPLHFIDFETSRPVLPFHRGHTPNQQLLFQFSHHVLDAAGRLDHRTDCLVADPGVPPSAPVLRGLQAALGNDAGTVVHWWDHERNVLEDVQEQLARSTEPDRDALVDFIGTLTGDNPRLADLGRLVARTAFFAGTEGRSSIKKVLAAVLAQSDLLRQRYSQPLYGTPAMPSCNFPAGFIWYREHQGRVLDPYALLDPLFDDPALDAALTLADDETTTPPDFIANGGAAIIAYAELQRPDLRPPHRQRLKQQLLRYCELDTLAMVMVYQALVVWVGA